MTAFIVYEKGDGNSSRYGVWVEAKSLTAAKRWATMKQMFQHAVLEIRDQTGTILSWKIPGSRWFDL